MERYGRIAIGIDLEPDGHKISLGSRRAVRQARDLASRTGASISFLHSTFRESDDPSAAHDTPPSEKLSAESWSVLESTSHEFADENIHTSLHFTAEPAWIELCRWSVRGDADLVIVGKRSRTIDDNRQMGTIAAELIRNCPAPVWLVHPDRKPGDGSVLAATDRTPVGTRVTEMASYVAKLYGTKLDILHAVPSEGSSEAEIRREILDDLGTDDGVEVHIVRGSPPNAISAALAELTPNLLVMGSLSRAGRTAQSTGSTAELVFPAAECSLLTIKPDSFVSRIE